MIEQPEYGVAPLGIARRGSSSASISTIATPTLRSFSRHMPEASAIAQSALAKIRRIDDFEIWSGFQHCSMRRGWNRRGKQSAFFPNAHSAATTCRRWPPYIASLVSPSSFRAGQVIVVIAETKLRVDRHVVTASLRVEHGQRAVRNFGPCSAEPERLPQNKR